MLGAVVAAALMLGTVRSIATVTMLLGALALPATSLTLWVLELMLVPSLLEGLVGRAGTLGDAVVRRRS